jgi:hypothetical protein
MRLGLSSGARIDGLRGRIGARMSRGIDGSRLGGRLIARKAPAIARKNREARALPEGRASRLDPQNRSP